MSNRIEQAMAFDFSRGTERFRESLLQRCLSAIDDKQNGVMELDDAELDMLAAAGDLSMLGDDLSHLGDGPSNPR